MRGGEGKGADEVRRRGRMGRRKGRVGPQAKACPRTIFLAPALPCVFGRMQWH